MSYTIEEENATVYDKKVIFLQRIIHEDTICLRHFLKVSIIFYCKKLR